MLEIIEIESLGDGTNTKAGTGHDAALWVSATRYYKAVLMRDLLGDWIVMTARGGRNNRLGALRTESVQSHKHGIDRIARLGRMRARHGYIQCL
jgi:hypothetical protein